MEKSISRAELVFLKSRALRKRVWFKILDRAERALIDLTIRVVEKVRSEKLARVLMNPIEKLKNATKSLMEKVREIGRPLAETISKIGRMWGNPDAPKWVGDENFIEFLGLQTLNTKWWQGAGRGS